MNNSKYTLLIGHLWLIASWFQTETYKILFMMVVALGFFTFGLLESRHEYNMALAKYEYERKQLERSIELAEKNISKAAKGLKK